MTWRFIGRSAALAAGRTAVSGWCPFLDGAAAGTIGLRSAVPRNRQAVWAKNLGASGTHTVKVVVAGAARRPGVVLDGLVVLR